MKFLYKTVLMLCILSSASILMAQRFSIDSASIKIDREFVKAPVFHQAQRTYKSLSRPAYDVRWLQFLVTYTPTSSGKNVVWEDGLTAELTVLIPAKKEKGFGTTIMLTGKQVFYSVPGDGRKHYVLFQIPPAILTKYSGFTSYDNRDVSVNVYAAIVFRKGENNQVLATAFAEMKNRTPQEVARIFSRYYNSKIGVMKLEDAVLSKEKTPWQWIDTDLFDFPKSMMEGKQ